MGSLQKLEQKLDEVLNKKAPVKLPQSARKSLAGAFWWIALLLGVVQLWGAWSLWRLGHYLDPLERTINAVNEYLGYRAIGSDLGLFFYLAFIVLLIEAVILLLASPGLKAFKKTGWNLLFYSVLLNAVYGVVRAFSDVGGGFGVLVWSLVCSVLAAYFIFQVRDFFVGKSVSRPRSAKK